ncbi:MAG TPA: TIGR04222 domain-containing membrane protein [Pyrinomonadaceae bacterium]|jgi:uncharacterized protein (TIGR04222 family)
MEWLLHNPIADMYGPYFLLFYAVVILLVVVSAWLVLRAQDWTARMPLPPVPAEPDPYEIAYLRGGEMEVAETAIFSLMQRGYLQATERPDGTSFERTPEAAEAGRLPQLERRVLEWFSTPRRRAEIFAPLGLRYEVRGGCVQFEQKLRREHLLTPQHMEKISRLVWLTGALVLAALGGYKLVIALSRGRFNVAFLIIMCIVGLVMLRAVSRLPQSRLSRRGRQYLDRLQMAFAQLKDRYRQQPQIADTQPARFANSIDPTLILVGAFGVASLAGTPYEDYTRKMYGSQSSSGAGGTWGTSSSSADGGGSYSSSDSSSSDSGGGDGGGSSCGGGGCGGGGCGGCGGD